MEENILLNRGRCEAASRIQTGGTMTEVGYVPDAVVTPTAKTCKNCGHTRDKHTPTSFAGKIWNDFCPAEGHNWGSTQTIWREI